MRANYFSTEHDLRMVIAGTRLVRRIASMPALAKITDKEIFPGHKMETDDEIIATARNISWTVFHQCGTCRMGMNVRDSVVDNKLKVHGIKTHVLRMPQFFQPYHRQYQCAGHYGRGDGRQYH